MGVLESAMHALVMIADPARLALLSLGVVIGLILGILPGIGGTAALALLLPFTFAMDPFMALAFLLGLAAVGETVDPIPAILFGVPGGSSSQATVMDGLPMARNGEAGRALSAAYSSSLLGGLFGAFILAIFMPLARPFVLSLGSPELLALSIFGMSMVAVLAGGAPLRGLAAAGIGVLLALVGPDPQTGVPRWTADTLYLWGGIQLLPMMLGIFALPELCDLAIKRSAISGEAKYSATSGMLQGAKDTFSNWFLLLRSSGLGALLGAVPGLGAAAVSWLSYGHALHTEAGARQTFGKGDVRGVIAVESANNAKEGGALVPTIAFGIPGSPPMAILLSALMIHGMVPGPDMLTKHLDVSYSMVWSIAIANILGAGLCYLFSGQFAKLAMLRWTLILPIIISVVLIGAFEGSRDWGDLYTLLAFGLVGWIMKQLKWPRPPLVLGFVLGALIERYMFISIARYDTDWIFRPVVIVLLSLAALGICGPFLKRLRAGGARTFMANLGRPRLAAEDMFPAGIIVLILVLVAQTADWTFQARLAPLIVCSGVLIFAGMSLLNQIFSRASLSRPSPVAASPQTGEEPEQELHMDLQSDYSGISTRTIAVRGLTFFLWIAGFMAVMALAGFLPALVTFVIGYMRSENRERWSLVLTYAAAIALFVYVVFDVYMAIPWPASLLGSLIPALRVIPTV